MQGGQVLHGGSSLFTGHDPCNLNAYTIVRRYSCGWNVCPFLSRVCCYDSSPVFTPHHEKKLDVWLSQIDVCVWRRAHAQKKIAQPHTTVTSAFPSHVKQSHLALLILVE